MKAPFVPRSVAPDLPIRMIALDIDGTLVDDDLALGDRTRDAVRAALDRGVHVSIATGRMTLSAVQFATLLELRDPVIGYQGALIRAMPEPDQRVGRMLRHRPLAAAVAREVVTWSRRVGLEPHANHLEKLIIPADDPRIDDYSAFLGTKALRVKSLVDWIRRPVTKIVAVGEAGLPLRLLNEARDRFAGRADATLAHPRFLEFVAPGVSKGQAVRWLARRHGVPLGQVLAIGDQLNDLEMISAVGHGTAMPHAPAQVIEAARYLAPSIREEGAARMIERLVLATPPKARRAAVALDREATELRGAA